MRHLSEDTIRIFYVFGVPLLVEWVTQKKKRKSVWAD